MRQIVFLLAAFNPARLAAALPASGRRTAAAVAAAFGLGAVIVAAALSEPLLDAIDVSASTFRIAAGVVVAMGGLVRLADALPRPEPGIGGWRAGIVPLAFPLLLAPDLVLLAISLGADEGVAPVAVGGAIGAAAVVAAAWVPRPLGPRARFAGAGAARMLAAVLVVAGVALAVDGVQDL